MVRFDSVVTITLVFATLEVVDIQTTGPICTSLKPLNSLTNSGIWSGAAIN
jgi:hypothetical protein